MAEQDMEMAPINGGMHALVIGLQANGLAVVRSLARKKVPVIVMLDEKDNVYAKTRYGRKLLVPKLDGPAVADALRNIPEKTVLFPTLEHIVSWLSANRATIPERHSLLFPDQEVVSLLLDKDRFEGFARQSGLLIPRSWSITEVDECDNVIQEGGFPMVVKPLHKQYISEIGKAVVVYSPQGLRDSVQVYLDNGAQCIVQEYIDGGDDRVFFCMQYISKTGTVNASFVGRKIRQWRPLTGGTASCEPAGENDLHEMTATILKKAGFWGIGSVEYKKNPENEKFYCIEPTVCRTDFQESVAICNGVNIPYVAFCDAIGKPLSMQRQNPGSNKAWMHFTNDRLAGEELIRTGNLTRIQWLKSLRNVRCFDFFSISDPGPMWHFARQTLLNKVRK